MLPRSVSERVALAVFIAGVAIYASVIFTYTAEAAGGSDSSGYANGAKAIARGIVEERITDLDRLGLDDSFSLAFTPLGYFSLRPRYVTPSFPPGMSMHMALAGAVFGFKHAPFYVSALAAVIGVILMALLAHYLFDSWWIAAGAAFAMGLASPYIFIAIQTMSDVLTTTWTIAAMFAAWKSRDDARWAAVAGAALGVSVWIRPSNLLVGLAIIYAMPWTKKAFAWCAAGGALLAIPFFVWNARHYGSALTTGYGEASYLFGVDYIPSHAWHYLRWTAQFFTPLVFIGAIYSLVRARHERIHHALALWFWSLFVFYCFYGPYEAWWYTRFLLPAYPAIILSTIYAARAIGIRAVAIALVLIPIPSLYFTAHYDVLHNISIDQPIYPLTIRWIDRELPPDALLVTVGFSGARKYYDDRFSVRYDLLDKEHQQILEQKVPIDRWWLVVADYDAREALARLGGRWTKTGQLRNVILFHRDPDAVAASNSVKGAS